MYLELAFLLFPFVARTCCDMRWLNIGILNIILVGK